jgi:hypothetical protein
LKPRLQKSNKIIKCKRLLVTFYNIGPTLKYFKGASMLSGTQGRNYCIKELNCDNQAKID